MSANFTVYSSDGGKRRLDNVEIRPGKDIRAGNLPGPLSIRDGPARIDKEPDTPSWGEACVVVKDNVGMYQFNSLDSTALSEKERHTIGLLKQEIQPKIDLLGEVMDQTVTSVFGDLLSFFKSNTRADVVEKYAKLGSEYGFLVDAARKLKVRGDADQDLLDHIIGKDEEMRKRIWG